VAPGQAHYRGRQRLGHGAGFWYQLAADITIASDQAVFAQPEVRHISARATS